MGKWILRIVVGLVILLIVAGVVLYFTIDGLVRTGITSGTTAATGTDTDLTTAHVSLIGSRGLELEGLELQNPEGFNKENFLSLDDGEIDVSLNSLMSDTVVIPKLELSGIRLLVENKGMTLNLRAIQSNIQKNTATSGQKTPEGEGKKFVIKQIKISDVKLAGNIGGIPGVDIPKINASVPDITLENVGSESGGGVVLSQVVSQILDEILKSGTDVLSQTTGVALDKFTGSLEGMQQKAQKRVEQAKQKATKATEQATDKATDKMKKAGEKAGKQVDETVDKAANELKGIFGGRQKNKDESNDSN